MRKTLTLLLVLSGCGTQEGSEKRNHDTGEDPCLESEEVELAVDEASPLGFSGQEVLDWLDDGASAPLTWSDGSTATISFTFAAGERGIHYADFEQNPEADGICETADRLYVGVAYTFATDDGRLDETGDYVTWGETRDEVRFIANSFGVGGPLDDCVNGEGSEQELEATFTPGATTGVLNCEGEKVTTLATW